MHSISVPQSAMAYPQIAAGDIRFVHYTERDSNGKNHVHFSQFAISFVLNGVKEIYTSAGNTTLTTAHGMLIPGGNTLIAEHTENEQPYSSFIVFFPQERLRNFLSTRHTAHADTTQLQTDCFTFLQQGHIAHCLQTLVQLVDEGATLSAAMAVHKLDELLLALYEVQPDAMAALPAPCASVADKHLRALLHNNLYKGLSLQELAFLAHRSVSSFKRDCERVTGMPPQQYMREQRLEQLRTALEQGKHPSELFEAFGYENQSNMNTAFKKRYGVTPAAYRADVLAATEE